jgi:hypothetical protein
LKEYHNRKSTRTTNFKQYHVQATCCWRTGKGTIQSEKRQVAQSERLNISQTTTRRLHATTSIPHAPLSAAISSKFTYRPPIIMPPAMPDYTCSTSIHCASITLTRTKVWKKEIIHMPERLTLTTSSSSTEVHIQAAELRAGSNCFGFLVVGCHKRWAQVSIEPCIFADPSHLGVWQTKCPAGGDDSGTKREGC